MGPDLTVQRRITYILLVEYFLLILIFLSGMGFLVWWAIDAVTGEGIFREVPDWITVLIAWIQGNVGAQIGTLTGSVKDASGFWLNSSFGSKTKDRPPV